MPFYQLPVEMFTIFRSHEWSLGEHILNLRSYFAEFDVLSKGDDSYVLANDILDNISQV